MQVTTDRIGVQIIFHEGEFVIKQVGHEHYLRYVEDEGITWLLLPTHANHYKHVQQLSIAADMLQLKLAKVKTVEIVWHSNKCMLRTQPSRLLGLVRYFQRYDSIKSKSVFTLKRSKARKFDDPAQARKAAYDAFLYVFCD